MGEGRHEKPWRVQKQKVSARRRRVKREVVEIRGRKNTTLPHTEIKELKNWVEMSGGPWQRMGAKEANRRRDGETEQVQEDAPARSEQAKGKSDGLQ